MGGSSSDEPLGVGYHVSPITRGEYGLSSKIKEEVMELLDAESQNNPIMALIELSDIIGAIKGYLEHKFGDRINLRDLIKMAEATERAFQSGVRK